MPDHSGAASSRDYAFQSSGQAGKHAQRPFDQYDTEHDTNANNAPSTSARTHAHDLLINYPDFNAQEPPQGQFATYGFDSEAPLAWDWGGAMDFSEFTNNYEPQGELIQEPRNQGVSANDFNIAHLASTSESAYRSSHQPQGAAPGAQKPFSPPPRPPQRPAIQTGMKRKAESEPSSAVSQSASVTTENPPKRPNQSRTSSTVSPPPALTDASMTQITVASAAAEHAPHSTQQGHNEAQRRNEQNKGTGPQGRVIDVSKPRRVVESHGGSDTLPAGKVFPIQIGSELFRLSGASISSDGKQTLPFI